jgi:hypothetical protein
MVELLRADAVAPRLKDYPFISVLAMRRSPRSQT